MKTLKRIIIGAATLIVIFFIWAICSDDSPESEDDTEYVYDDEDIDDDYEGYIAEDQYQASRAKVSRSAAVKAYYTLYGEYPEEDYFDQKQFDGIFEENNSFSNENQKISKLAQAEHKRSKTVHARAYGKGGHSKYYSEDDFSFLDFFDDYDDDFDEFDRYFDDDNDDYSEYYDDDYDDDFIEELKEILVELKDLSEQINFEKQFFEKGGKLKELGFKSKSEYLKDLDETVASVIELDEYFKTEDFSELNISYSKDVKPFVKNIKSKASAIKKIVKDSATVASTSTSTKPSSNSNKPSNNSNKPSSNSNKPTSTANSTKPATNSNVGVSGSRDKFISCAKTYLGTPYVYGGTSRNGIDCSGFVYLSAIDAKLGTLPRTAKTIYTVTTAVNKDKRQPGDLVFFSVGSSITHVAIYLGNDQIIHAASDGPKTGVIISKLSENYWKTHYFASGKFIK